MTRLDRLLRALFARVSSWLGDSDDSPSTTGLALDDLRSTSGTAGRRRGMAPIVSDVQRRLVWKLDLILLPFLSILFLFNSLDKSNIGSAETVHFTQDIGVSSFVLNTSVALFFVAFVILQPLGAALGRKYGMARYVPVCMALWGLCTALHAGVRRGWQLVILRTMVGVLEAGFYPTTVSYLSLFYTRFEFAKRLGLFYGQAAVAGALGGLLSWAVFRQIPDPKHPTSTLGVLAQRPTWHSPLKPWQVLFLIEGIATICIAVLGFFWLPHDAGSAWFFTAEERACAEARIRLDRAKICADEPDIDATPSDLDNNKDLPSGRQSTDSTLRDSSEESRDLLAADPAAPSTSSSSSSAATSPTADRGITRADIESAFTGWHIWYLLACNILSAIPATAFSVFLPIVIKGLAYSSTDMGQTGEMAPATANLLTVPPFIAGALVLWAFTAWSDRYQERLRPVLWGMGILLVGLGATCFLPQTRYVERYLALIVLLSGSFVPSPLIVAWLTNNTLEPGKRAVVLGINGWGNLAGVLSAVLFSPRYRDSGYLLPFFVTLACVGVSFIGFAGFRAAVVATNRGRVKITDSWSLEMREREAKYGDVPVQLQRNWLEKLRGEGYARRGEERLTYHFTL